MFYLLADPSGRSLGLTKREIDGAAKGADAIRRLDSKYSWARARILDTVANLATHFQKL